MTAHDARLRGLGCARGCLVALPVSAIVWALVVLVLLPCVCRGDLLRAISAVESGNRDLPPRWDVNGMAVGRFQIHEPFARDVGRDWKRCQNKAYAEQTIRLYWRKYGARTDEQRARMINGGGRGHLKKCTRSYWVRVQKEMRKR